MFDRRTRIDFRRPGVAPATRVQYPIATPGASSHGSGTRSGQLVAHAPAGASRVAFPLDGGQRYMMVRREAIILNYSATAAWKHRDQVGVGLSLQWIHVPRLWYSLVIDANQFRGHANPVSSELDMFATTKGSDAFTPRDIGGSPPCFEGDDRLTRDVAGCAEVFLKGQLDQTAAGGSFFGREAHARPALRP